MVKTDEMLQKRKWIRQARVRSWAIFLPFVLIILLSPSMLTASDPQVLEEMNAEEKRSAVDELLTEGNQYFEQKNYNLANATYESVFLLDPDNIKASQKIDQLKKQMLKEGKSETQLVTRVYDSEIDLRTREYLKQAKAQIHEGKLGRARFTLQKLLLIDPLHEEAQKLYDETSQKLAGEGS